MPDRKIELALALREAYDEVSPMIEECTAEVCPDCTSVCCIDRHANHEPEDLNFLKALKAYGETDPLPSEPPLELDALPCRHLGASGCSIERWRRPHRCTWYFCSPLLKHFEEADPRAYRRLVAALRRVVEIRRELAEACAS